MIRRCNDSEFDTVGAIINDAAEAYRGIIPEDRWHDPYMSTQALRGEIDDGVVFWGYEHGGGLIGVMGIQDVQDVTLIRHAYVRTTHRSQGIGGQLLANLHRRVTRPTLVGTWVDATWAVRFYANRGFRQLSRETTNRLLRKYWSIPDRQVETSVVLADASAFDRFESQTNETDGEET